MSERPWRGRETSPGGAGAVAVLMAFGVLALARRIAGDTRGSECDDGAAANPKCEREPPSVREGVVAAVMAGFFAFVVVAAIGLSFFYRSLTDDGALTRVREFPAPRLQTHADGERDPEIARQQAELRVFRWIDRSRGQFQIPIERAMRLVAAHGAKGYDPVSPGTQASSRPPQPTAP